MLAGCAPGGGVDESASESTSEDSTTSPTTGGEDAGSAGDTSAEDSGAQEDGATEEEGEDGEDGGEKPPYDGIPPEHYCPDGPSGMCPEVEGAPLRVGTAVIDMVPDCFESWIDVAGNGTFNEGDDFLDCGCDRLCPPDKDYPGPDAGEGDNVFQRIFIAGFQNNRPARGVRGPDVGLAGEGDGIWCRALVLEQGETRVALVTLDTVGYFYDEVETVRDLLAGNDVDLLLVHSVHNHQGPDTMGLWGEEFFSGGFDPFYRAQVRATIHQSVLTAIADLEDVATMTVAEGDASTLHPEGQPEVGIRNVLNDTRDPFIVDESIGVIRFANAEDETLATLVNFASHPEGLSTGNTLLTAEYVHALRRTMEVGSTWKQADGKAGVGGTSLFISGALGGMMTPLGVETVSPDGEVYGNGDFDQSDAIGQLLGEAALDALENGDVIDNPRLEFASQSFDLAVLNPTFNLAFQLGVFDREVQEIDGFQTVRTEMNMIEIGPVRLLSVPGELLPELAVGGYDGSQMFTEGAELIDPDNDNPPDLDAAPPGPYLKARMDTEYPWIIGLGNDELGYIIPEYDFKVDNLLPYIEQVPGDHYEETNSVGPHFAGVVESLADGLIDFIDWL